MGVIADKAAETWRDYVTEGLPASGPHNVQKDDAREFGQLIDDAVGSVIKLGPANETVISANTVLSATAFGRSFIVGGAGVASLTITLPVATSANVGDLIALRIAEDYPSLATVSGSFTDSVASRAFWRGEVVTFEWTAAGIWREVEYKNRPIGGLVRRTTNLALPSNTYTPVKFQTTGTPNSVLGGDFSFLHLFFDPANQQIRIPRRGRWRIGFRGVVTVSAATELLLSFGINGEVVTLSELESTYLPSGATRGSVQLWTERSFAAGDYVVPLINPVATAGTLDGGFNATAFAQELL